MAGQDQKVGEGATAYQSGGSMTVTVGLSEQAVSEIIVALCERRLAEYHHQAMDTARARMTEMREELLQHFAKQHGGDSEAFRDPDFQYVVQDAHHRFARRGDAELKNELVRLLVARSRYPTAGRVASLLNKAIQISGDLSAQENAALAILFVMREVSYRGPDPTTTCIKIFSYVEPFIQAAPRTMNCCEYLGALGCATENPMTQTTPRELLYAQVRPYLRDSISETALVEALGSRERFAQLTHRLFRPNGAGQFQLVVDAPDFVRSGRTLGVTSEEHAALIKLIGRPPPDPARVAEIVTKALPRLSELEEIWSLANMAHWSLSALGKLIGHSVIAPHGFAAPIDVWLA